MRHAPGLLLALLLAAAGCGVETDERPESFAYIQAAILKPSCGTAACHNSQNKRASRFFDDPDTAYQQFMGTGVQAGDATDSVIITFYLTGDGDLRMPLDSPLPEADVALIARWIDDGARDN